MSTGKRIKKKIEYLTKRLIITLNVKISGIKWKKSKNVENRIITYEKKSKNT